MRVNGRERGESKRERGERGKRGERARKREERGEERRESETPDLDLDLDNFTICLPSRIFLNIEARTGF